MLFWMSSSQTDDAPTLKWWMLAAIALGSGIVYSLLEKFVGIGTGWIAGTIVCCLVIAFVFLVIEAKSGPSRPISLAVVSSVVIPLLVALITGYVQLSGNARKSVAAEPYCPPGVPMIPYCSVYECSGQAKRQ